jgi:hypothetical protein
MKVTCSDAIRLLGLTWMVGIAIGLSVAAL